MARSSRPRRSWRAMRSWRRRRSNARSRSRRSARSTACPAPASRSGSWDTDPVIDRSPGAELPEHDFRNEFRRLVAVLSRRFGMHRVELCEDAVQTALLRAVQSWSQRGLPHDTSAWLYRVAFNEVLGALRRERRTDASVDDAEQVPADTSAEDAVYLEHEVRDDQLRMLFVCADPGIPRESQLVFALKILCGFSTEEIALRLFQSHEAIYKRLQRARAALRERIQELDAPGIEGL